MKLLHITIALLISVSSFAQNTINQDSLWVRTNYEKKEVMITMRDGKKLFTAIYAPKEVGGKHPILFSRTPYSCAPYGENNYRGFYTGYLMKYLKAG